LNGEWVILLPLLLACGSVAGILAGLLGVGGGIVIVPMLYHVYTGLGIGVATAMPLSVGTSLSTIVFTSLVSARSHSRRGTVDWALVRRWIPWMLVGVVIGTLLGSYVPGAILKSVFGVLLSLVAAHMLLTATRKATFAEQLPTNGVQSGIATGVGSVAAMLGIGGGTLVVPILNLFSYPIHRAVGTAAVFGFVISVPATAGYVLSGWGHAGLPAVSTGYVNWLSFAALVPATMLFAPVGVRLCHRLNVARLKQVFAVFLLLVGLKMAIF
jgi:uncharacterized membrane protein YfcA